MKLKKKYKFNTERDIINFANNLEYLYYTDRELELLTGFDHEIIKIWRKTYGEPCLFSANRRSNIINLKRDILRDTVPVLKSDLWCDIYGVNLSVVANFLKSVNKKTFRETNIKKEPEFINLINWDLRDNDLLKIWDINEISLKSYRKKSNKKSIFGKKLKDSEKVLFKGLIEYEYKKYFKYIHGK